MMETRGAMSRKTLFIIVGIILVLGFMLSNYVSELIKRSEEYLTLLFDESTRDLASFELPSVGYLFKLNLEYEMVYIIVYLIAFVFLMKIYYDLKLNFESLDKGQHGTGEFATVDELKKQYRIIPSKDKEYEGSGGVIIAGLQEGRKPYRLLIDESPVHTMVIGITRSGKGETFVVPMLDVLSRAKEKASFVVNDPKGELAGASYETLKKRGYEVHIFNLIDQSMGMGFNPLQLVTDAWKNGERDKAVLYATSICHSLYHNPNSKEPMWEQSAASLVTAIILAIVEDSIAKGEEHKINMYSVGVFLSTLGSDNNERTGENALDQFFKARPIGNAAKEMYATANFSGGNMRSSIFSMAMNKLQIFTSEPNARLTAYNSMNLTDIGFGDKPIALFMVTPDFDSSNHVLASILVSQLYRVNAERATLEDGKMKRHVHFMLDEFGNMPTIEGMASMVTVGAGRGFRFHLIIQAYSQVKTLYGEESETIIGNCSNQIYILTQDKSTAEHYSGLLGTKTITDVSRSGNLFSFNKSHSESTKERELLKADELMRLKLGESVVLRVNKRDDLKRNHIVAKPIYNKGPTAHKFRYAYLADDFDTSNSVISLPISSPTYFDLDLSEIIFNSLPKPDDQYIEIAKLMTKKQFDGLKVRLQRFCQTELSQLPDMSKWSTLHLLSYLVYEKRPEMSYFQESLGARGLNLESFVAAEVIDEWSIRLEQVVLDKGAYLFNPKAS